MTVKQEEIKVKLPSIILQRLDKLIESGWYDSRDDCICYTLRRYADEMERCEELKEKLKE